MKPPKIQLRPEFLERVEKTGLTDSAVAAAMGLTRQFYHQVKTGERQPSAGFMAGAVSAGLASTFADVAEIARPSDEQALAS